MVYLTNVCKKNKTCTEEFVWLVLRIIVRKQKRGAKLIL